jgi:hypothetical protein
MLRLSIYLRVRFFQLPHSRIHFFALHCVLTYITEAYNYHSIMLLSSYLGCAFKKRCGTLLLHTTLRAGQTCPGPLLRTAFRPGMINLINVVIREYNYPSV